MVDEENTSTNGYRRYNIVDLQRTSREVGPYIVSLHFIVGNGFIRSAKPAHGGRPMAAPTTDFKV